MRAGSATASATAPDRDRSHELPLALAVALLLDLLAVNLALQVRPLHWDTYQAGASLEAFDAQRKLLMAGAWLRPMLLLPLALLAAGLRRRLGGGDLARAGSLLLLAAGVLHVAAGAVATVIGVPAEEYRPGGPDAHALEVLADSLFWVQDDLVTLANLALAAGIAALAWEHRHTPGLPRWATRAGVAALPLMTAAAMSFVGVLPDRAAQPWWYGAWYLAGVIAAYAACGAWLVAVLRAPAAAAR
jgi:hypothetical protein